MVSVPVPLSNDQQADRPHFPLVPAADAPMHSASSKSAAKSSRVMCFFISRPLFFVFLHYIVLSWENQPQQRPP